MIGSAPRPGKRVSSGSTVLVATKFPPCGVASPAVPVPLPKPSRVPSFVGMPLSAAIGWVEERHLSWAATIPPLKAGDAPTLYANYVITNQKPRPGASLSVGTDRHGGWLPTPLQLKVRSS